MKKKTEIINSSSNKYKYFLYWTDHQINRQSEKQIFCSQDEISMLYFYPPLFIIYIFILFGVKVADLLGIEEHWELFQLQFYPCFWFSSKH